LLTIGYFSARAWAMKHAVERTWCGPGSRPARIPCSAVTARISIRSTRQVFDKIPNQVCRRREPSEANFLWRSPRQKTALTSEVLSRFLIRAWAAYRKMRISCHPPDQGVGIKQGAQGAYSQPSSSSGAAGLKKFRSDLDLALPRTGLTVSALVRDGHQPHHRLLTSRDDNFLASASFFD